MDFTEHSLNLQEMFSVYRDQEVWNCSNCIVINIYKIFLMCLWRFCILRNNIYILFCYTSDLLHKCFCAKAHISCIGYTIAICWVSIIASGRAIKLRIMTQFDCVMVVPWLVYFFIKITSNITKYLWVKSCLIGWKYRVVFF